jgi:hypothetical protein
MKLVYLWSSGAVLASDTRSGHTLTRRVVFKIQTPSFFELKHFRERMGYQKQKWTAEKEEALLGGVAKHGPGKWKNILKDPDFAPFLTHRSNIDLKVPPYLPFHLFIFSIYNKQCLILYALIF